MFGPDLAYVKLEDIISMDRFKVVGSMGHSLQAGPESLPIKPVCDPISQTLSPKEIHHNPKEASVKVDTESGVKSDHTLVKAEQVSKPTSLTMYQGDAQHSNAKTISGHQ